MLIYDISQFNDLELELRLLGARSNMTGERDCKATHALSRYTFREGMPYFKDCRGDSGV